MNRRTMNILEVISYPVIAEKTQFFMEKKKGQVIKTQTKPRGGGLFGTLWTPEYKVQLSDGTEELFNQCTMLKYCRPNIEGHKIARVTIGDTFNRITIDYLYSERLGLQPQLAGAFTKDNEFIPSNRFYDEKIQDVSAYVIAGVTAILGKITKLKVLNPTSKPSKDDDCRVCQAYRYRLGTDRQWGDINGGAQEYGSISTFDMRDSGLHQDTWTCAVLCENPAHDNINSANEEAIWGDKDQGKARIINQTKDEAASCKFYCFKGDRKQGKPKSEVFPGMFAVKESKELNVWNWQTNVAGYQVMFATTMGLV